MPALVRFPKVRSDSAGVWQCASRREWNSNAMEFCKRSMAAGRIWAAASMAFLGYFDNQPQFLRMSQQAMGWEKT